MHDSDDAPAKNCTVANAALFFDVRRAGQAVELCLDCPLMIPCGRQARATGEMHGVWGAETAEERCAWLVQHHPDEEVRTAAELVISEAERQRNKSRKYRIRTQAKPPSRSVQHRMAKDGDFKPPRLAAAQEAARTARRLHGSGQSIGDIASALKVSTRTIERYLSAQYDRPTV